MITNVKSLKKHLQDLDIKKPCGVAVGGSMNRDIDLLYVAEKIDFEDVELIRTHLEKALGKEVSIYPMTELMVRSGVMTGKCARMFYKGVSWIKGFYDIPMSYERMRDISIRNAPEELSRFVKEAGHKRDKMFELLVQLTTILIGGENGEDSYSSEAPIPVDIGRAVDVLEESRVKSN
jgi:hypothetical protein